MELKGSRTEADLATAFAGESEARNRYDFYAKKAKEDGYEQIAAIFEETAPPFSAEDGGTPANRGFAVACVATYAKKVGCTEPLSLGEARKASHSLFQDGRQRVIDGLTSLDELLRVTRED